MPRAPKSFRVGTRHVADQKVIAVRAEVRRGLGNPPGVLQRPCAGAVSGELVLIIAAGGKYVHRAAATASWI
jgi:hypothetical protein